MEARLMDIVLMFFVYAFIGWLVEVLYHYKNHKRFVNRGFLHAPILPIYGLSAISLHLLYANTLEGLFANELVLAVVIFLIVFFISSLFELIGGWLLMRFFGARWWDYSHLKYHINGFVSLRFSFIWGFFGTILFFGVHMPLVLPFLNVFEASFQLFLGIVLLIGHLIDTIFTLLALVNFKSLLLELKQNMESLKEVADTIQPSKAKVNMYNFRQNILRALHSFSNHETFKKIEKKVDQIKEVAPRETHSKSLRVYRSIRRITTKISHTRFYQVFPNLRIALQKNEKASKRDSHE